MSYYHKAITVSKFVSELINHFANRVYMGPPCVHMKPVYLLIQVKGFIFEREVVEL